MSAARKFILRPVSEDVNELQKRIAEREITKASISDPVELNKLESVSHGLTNILQADTTPETSRQLLEQFATLFFKFQNLRDEISQIETRKRKGPNLEDVLKELTTKVTGGPTTNQEETTTQLKTPPLAETPKTTHKKPNKYPEYCNNLRLKAQKQQAMKIISFWEDQGNQVNFDNNKNVLEVTDSQGKTHSLNLKKTLHHLTIAGPSQAKREATLLTNDDITDIRHLVNATKLPPDLMKNPSLQPEQEPEPTSPEPPSPFTTVSSWLTWLPGRTRNGVF